MSGDRAHSLPIDPWRIEETCFNAFPSLKQVILDGWLLRFSKGVSRRANSANPLHPDHAAPESVIGQIKTVMWWK